MLDKKIVKHIFLFVWCIIIFIFSSDIGFDSDLKSKGIVYNIVDIYEKVSDETIDDDKRIQIIDNLNRVIRKGAHFTLYLVLGILAYSCFLEYDFNTKKTIILTICFCITYAISDEVHQLFVSGRDGRLFDVLIDSSGSTLGTFVYYWLKVLKN